MLEIILINVIFIELLIKETGVFVTFHTVVQR